MRAWPAPEVPSPSGAGPALRLHDTATGELRETAPGPVARMYVCGITPYDATHLGHAATYVAFDLVGRVWRDLGHRVHYVQNVTDVDDPLLERAARDGEDWRALAERETDTFRADMTALRVLPPDDFVGAAETVPQMVAAVQGLQGRGATYDVDGDTYFAVHADRRFGAVAGLDEASMVELFAEGGGDPDRAGKKHPLDPVLWQTGGPAEPAWDSPLGRGRPGWHIECATIALDRLGNGFDVQGGGSDLAFPHHEMSASQAHVLTGEWPFARHYVHAGMVGLDGEKMSKSRGNLVLVSALRREGRDPMAIRLALLAHHYRSDWDWTEDDLAAAEHRLQRWRTAVRRRGAPAAGPVVDAVRRHLADDLDAPGALAALDAWTNQALSDESLPDDFLPDDAGSPAEADDAAAGAVAGAVDALLGVRL